MSDAELGVAQPGPYGARLADHIMLFDWTLVFVLAVIFIATVIRSAFGFGEALVAVPLLSLVMPEKIAVPLAVLVSITVAVVVVVQDWHKIHIRSAGWLVLFTLPGTLLGAWVLASAAAAIVTAILAVAIIGFSTYCLIGRLPFELRNDRLAGLFGFLAGIMGGLYGINGPPLVIYGAMRRWPPDFFRATLQAYFLPASLFGMANYWWNDLWVPEVTHYFLLSLPVALAAIFVGHFIHRRLKDRKFLTYVHIGLILIGIVLLLQSVFPNLKTHGQVDERASQDGSSSILLPGRAAPHRADAEDKHDRRIKENPVNQHETQDEPDHGPDHHQEAGDDRRTD